MIYLDYAANTPVDSEVLKVPKERLLGIMSEDIYNRFLASQMSAAIYDTMNVTINANNYDFKASGQNLKFKGFMALYVEGTDLKEQEEQEMLPDL